MQDRLTTSIVLYGNIDSKDSFLWRDFLKYATGLIRSVNLTPNYLGITGQSFRTGKVSPLSKMQNKLLKSLDGGEEVVSLALYSLPENFRTAAFDYNVYICRTKQSLHPHLIATFSSADFECLDREELEYDLKKLINFECGQIFELSSLESPQIYASRANSLSAFKSLKVIDEIK